MLTGYSSRGYRYEDGEKERKKLEMVFGTCTLADGGRRMAVCAAVSNKDQRRAEFASVQRRPSAEGELFAVLGIAVSQSLLPRTIPGMMTGKVQDY